MGKEAKFLALMVAFFGIVTFTQAQDGATAASLYNDALAKLKAKDFDAALPLFEQAIETADPESETDSKVVKLAKRNGAIAAYYVGNDLRKSDKFEEALATYDKGIEYASGFYANYIGRAQALEGKGDNVEAIKAYVMAAEMSEKGGKADKAGDLINKAENFAAVAWGDKKWDDAISYAETFLALKETADAHYYMAQSLQEKGENQKALEHAEKALAMAGDDKNKFYFTKAEIHEALGQTSEAVDAYKMVGGSKYGERAKYKVDQLSGGK